MCEVLVRIVDIHPLAGPVASFVRPPSETLLLLYHHPITHPLQHHHDPLFLSRFNLFTLLRLTLRQTRAHVPRLSIITTSIVIVVCCLGFNWIYEHSVYSNYDLTSTVPTNSVGLSLLPSITRSRVVGSFIPRSPSLCRGREATRLEIQTTLEPAIHNWTGSSPPSHLFISSYR